MNLWNGFKGGNENLNAFMKSFEQYMILIESSSHFEVINLILNMINPIWG